ncbi:hypothetical protein HMPREF9622_01472 [Cutibacterium modestum HL037PA3]|nr:hypothetical protein HMPREF9621_01742 [Cutibacterium modestum HL037PA2]EFT15475.1 hypothetical protein HMPREF9622_01472 [Cutibacterium modestum HL037PA3]
MPRFIHHLYLLTDRSSPEKNGVQGKNGTHSYGEIEPIFRLRLSKISPITVYTYCAKGR